MLALLIERRRICLQVKEERTSLGVTQHSAEAVSSAMQTGVIGVAHRRIMMPKNMSMLICAVVTVQPKLNFAWHAVVLPATEQ